MAKVRLEFLSWLADTVGAPAGNNAFEEDMGDGRTVSDLLVRLAGEHPRFQTSVFDIGNLSLNAGVAIFHNGRQIELENGLQTLVTDGDSVVFVPVLAGGS